MKSISAITASRRPQASYLMPDSRPANSPSRRTQAYPVVGHARMELQNAHAAILRQRAGRPAVVDIACEPSLGRRVVRVITWAELPSSGLDSQAGRSPGRVGGRARQAGGLAADGAIAFTPGAARRPRSATSRWWTHGPPLRAPGAHPPPGRSEAAGPFGAAGLNRRSLGPRDDRCRNLLSGPPRGRTEPRPGNAHRPGSRRLPANRRRPRPRPGPPVRGRRPRRRPRHLPSPRVGEDADRVPRRPRAGLARCRDRGAALHGRMRRRSEVSVLRWADAADTALRGLRRWRVPTRSTAARTVRRLRYRSAALTPLARRSPARRPDPRRASTTLAGLPQAVMVRHAAGGAGPDHTHPDSRRRT